MDECNGEGGNSQRCILVTGGAGYIGSHTAVEVISAGYLAVIVDNLCNSSFGAFLLLFLHLYHAMRSEHGIAMINCLSVHPSVLSLSFPT